MMHGKQNYHSETFWNSSKIQLSARNSATLQKKEMKKKIKPKMEN